MSRDWFVEEYPDHAGLMLEVRRRLYDAKSPYQRIEIVETVAFGRLLALDGCVMLTERDEYVYHEMLAHPALCAHPAPERVLVIGGGDGGTVREVVRHAAVREVHLVEIDRMVVEASRAYLPTVSAGLSDPRVSVRYADGFDHLEGHPAAYDVILVDSIDPVGESAKLFTSPFYERVQRALRPGGLAVFETESPLYHGDVLRRVTRSLKALFPHVATYLAAIPTYPSGLWSFTFVSQAIDPLTIKPRFAGGLPEGLKYFTPSLYHAAFVLPRFVEELVQR